MDVLARAGVAGESDARARVLTHVAKDHALRGGREGGWEGGLGKIMGIKLSEKL